MFLYLVNRRIPVDFRQFLIRHAGLLRFVRTWTLRLLVPRRFRTAVSVYKAAVREELWTPMESDVDRDVLGLAPIRLHDQGDVDVRVWLAVPSGPRTEQADVEQILAECGANAGDVFRDR